MSNISEGLFHKRLYTNACENINNKEAAIPGYFNNIRIVAYNVS